MQFSIRQKDATASTNDDVWQLACEGAPTGTVVVARSQRKGRGQWGRVWVSPEGGLYFSILLRPSAPKAEWPEYGVEFAEAIAGVIRQECGLDQASVWVKHPNDVVCAQGKLCGISLESKEGDFVVGIGVNVYHPDRTIETDGRNTPAYMQDLGLPGIPSAEYLDELLVKLLAAIGTVRACS